VGLHRPGCIHLVEKDTPCEKGPSCGNPKIGEMTSQVRGMRGKCKDRVFEIKREKEWKEKEDKQVK
jgi:hypothetical protein